MDRQSNALAHALVRRGVRRGDRVIVFADNTVEAAVSFFGVLKANAVVCMVNPQTKEDKLAYLLNDCRARAIISDAHLRSTLLPAVRQSRHLAAALISGPVDLSCVEGVPGDSAVGPGVAGRAIDQPPPPRNIDIDLASIHLHLR